LGCCGMAFVVIGPVTYLRFVCILLIWLRTSHYRELFRPIFLQHLMLFLLLLGFQKRVICLLLDIRDMLVGVGRQWGLEDSRIHLDRMTSVEQLLDLEDDLNSHKKKQQLLVG